MNTDSSNLEMRSSTAAGFLYRLTVAFPSWGSAIVAVYSICLGGLAALKIRSR